MSFSFPPGFFPVTDGMLGTTLLIEAVGIVANAFMCFILLRYTPKWPTGKLLLFAYHFACFIFLCCFFFPLAVVGSTREPYASNQCKAPAVLIQLSGVFQILSLALMAHIRWRIIDCESRSDPGAPDAKKYLAGLVAFVVLLVIAVQIHGETINAPFMWLWHVLICVRLNRSWSVIFYMIFFGSAPYLAFCYYKVVQLIREMVDGSEKSNAAKEPIRLIYALTGFYYLTHLPFYLLFLYVQSSGNFPGFSPYQGLKMFQLSYSSIVPFVSICLTKKYRKTALAILTCQTQGDMKTTKGGSTGSVSDSDQTKSGMKKEGSTTTMPMEA